MEQLDHRQVEAFVAAAEHRHFGRAAQSLFLTQQALSKRIARLEDQVGALFERGPTGVSLTERGERFLPSARHLLDAADHALAAARGEERAALRVDVWGPIDPPEAMVRTFAVEHPEVIVEVSMRRNLAAALSALWRNELDIALGNVANLQAPLPQGLSSLLVTFTAAAGLVDEHDELARAKLIRPSDLRGRGLAVPAPTSRQEFARFVTEYAKAIDVPLSTDDRNADLDGLVDRVAADPLTVTLVPANWPVPEGRGLRLVPVCPVPVHPWYAVWRTGSPHPLIPRLVRTLRERGGAADLFDQEYWLPAAAREDLPPGSLEIESE